MRSNRPVLVLLIVATVAFSACMSTEKIHFDIPQRIAEDPTLQFDFTLPILDDASYRRIRVTVSFDGQAAFYIRDNERSYKRIRTALLTDEEMTVLVNVFEEAGFATYPMLVPRKGQLVLPAHVVQLGYRSGKGSAPRTVSGAVSKQRNRAAYPAGFFELIDGLADFVEEKGKFRIHPEHVASSITAGSE